MDQNGFMTMPVHKLGKQLDSNTVRAAIDFYTSDNSSSAFPGKRDCITINEVEDGEKITKQHRLLLLGRLKHI